MDEVKKEVERILNKIFVGNKYDLYYGTSSDGIPYAILTTASLWYKVWVIGYVKANSDARWRNKSTLVDMGENVFIRATQHPTKSRTDAYITKCKEELAKGLNHCFFHPKDHTSPPRGHYFFVEKLPEEAIKHPDKYMKPGDLILSTFVKVFYHAGIYIGNGEVVHVSGHGGGKDASVARIGKLCPDFVKTDGNIWIMDCVYHFRTPEKIVEIAKQYANNDFRKGKYDLTAQNCQHFAALCAFGVEFSIDATSMREFLEQVQNSIANF